MLQYMTVEVLDPEKRNGGAALNVRGQDTFIVYQVYSRLGYQHSKQMLNKTVCFTQGN